MLFTAFLKKSHILFSSKKQHSFEFDGKKKENVIFFFYFQVTHSFCKEFLQGLLTHLDHDGELNVTELMRRLFEKGSKARMLSQAYHRYALNYINALNYLESLRRHNDFCDFEKVFFAKKRHCTCVEGFHVRSDI